MYFFLPWIIWMFLFLFLFCLNVPAKENSYIIYVYIIIFVGRRKNKLRTTRLALTNIEDKRSQFFLLLFFLRLQEILLHHWLKHFEHLFIIIYYLCNSIFLHIFNLLCDCCMRYFWYCCIWSNIRTFLVNIVTVQ